MCPHLFLDSIFRHLSPHDVHSEEVSSYDSILEIVRKSQMGYENALSLSPSAEGFYDLGSSFYSEAVILLLSRGQGSGILPSKYFIDGTVKDNLTKAGECFGKGVKLDPLHSGCWNGMGLCSLDEKIKNYCFARATQLDGNSSALSNLAFNHIYASRLVSARDCFSEIQFKDSNPNIWVGLGAIFEMTAAKDTYRANTSMASDAYEAAIEIAKPVESLLASVVSFLTINGYLQPNLSLNYPSELKGTTYCTTCEMIELKHTVENRLRAYLHRRPVHPFAWSMLAWVLEVRGSYESASSAHKSGLESVEVILRYMRSDNFRLGLNFKTILSLYCLHLFLITEMCLQTSG